MNHDFISTDIQNKEHMTLTNHFAPLAYLDTTHLNDKGQKQVTEFVQFVEPPIDDIKRGDSAKTKVAEYFLEHQSTYTDGARSLLDPLMEQLCISPGYRSKLQTALKYRSETTDKSLQPYIAEHPVTVQYLMAKIPHDEVHEKMMSGYHFSQREAAAKVSSRKPDKKAEGQELTHDHFMKEKHKELAADPEYKYLSDEASAKVYCSGQTKAIILACMQVLSEINWHNPKYEKALTHLQHLAKEASQKPKYTGFKLTK